METLGFIVEYAMSFLGVPYKYGGRNRLEGLDCSQFVIEQMISLGVLPHGFDGTAQGLYDRWKWRGEQGPELGALAFYGASREKVSHVALCLSNSQMIEAGGGDSDTDTLPEAVARSAMVRIRPVKYRKDYLCSVMPPYKP